MEDSTQALTVYDGGAGVALDMVRPLVNPAAARQAIVQYEALKQAIQLDGDVMMYQGRPFLRKRFWRRVATCFGLSLELVSQERGFEESGRLYYSVLYRAIAPNGRTMIGDGYCSNAEKGHEAWPEHTVRATAHTRAKNRAISDLVGGGEVSAEELPDFDDAPAPAPRQQTPQRPAPSRATVTPAPTDPAADARAMGQQQRTNGNMRKALDAKPAGDAFAALRLRAVKAGITSQEDWEAVCEEYAGATDPAKMTLAGKQALVAYVEQLEAAKAAAAAKIVDAAGSTDLADLPPVAMVP